jgi:hypothetical protein
VELEPAPQALGYMRRKTEKLRPLDISMAKIQAKMREAYGK